MATIVTPCSDAKMTQAQYEACMATWQSEVDLEYMPDCDKLKTAAEREACLASLLGTEDKEEKKTAQWPVWVKLVLVVAFGCLVFFGLKKLMS